MQFGGGDSAMGMAIGGTQMQIQSAFEMPPSSQRSQANRNRAVNRNVHDAAGGLEFVVAGNVFENSSGRGRQPARQKVGYGSQRVAFKQSAGGKKLGSQWVPPEEAEKSLSNAEFNRFVNPVMTHNFPSVAPSKILRAKGAQKRGNKRMIR